MSTLHLKVITPEKTVFDDEVNQVIVTTPEGEIGILPHHANLMTRIVPGEMKIIKNGKEEIFATGEGLLQVVDNMLSVLIDLARKAEDIDEKMAEEARKRAEEALEQKLTDEEYALAVANLEKALAQLKVKRRHRSI